MAQGTFTPRMIVAAWLCVGALMTSWATAAESPASSVVSAAEVPSASQIRANLSQRLTNLPKIDEVSATNMAGLFEVRIDQQVFYTDAQGNFLLRGELIDTRTLRNLTQERVAKLTAIEFAQLPLKDAIVWRSGTGKRRVAVFADPNCGYCKKLEQELQKVKDVTVYTFVLPILGPDSNSKAQAIWCSKDVTQTWRSWMLQGAQPPAVPTCESPIARNQSLAQSLRISGTPAMFFEDGSRSSGWMSAAQIENQLLAQTKPRSGNAQ